MSKRTKQALVLAALVAALVIGAGAAVAGGLGFDNDQQAFLVQRSEEARRHPGGIENGTQGAYGDRLTPRSQQARSPRNRPTR